MNKKIILIITLVFVGGMLFGFGRRAIQRPGRTALKTIRTSFLSSYVEYKWQIGSPVDSRVNAVLKFDNDDLVLTCSGTGAMKDYDPEKLSFDWYRLYDKDEGWSTSIDKIHVDEGIILIGSYDFALMDLTKEIYLPSTLKTIKKDAFGVSKDCIIYYNATISDWNKLDLEEGWDCSDTISKINCTDGIVEVQKAADNQ
ncbi:MAG: hypothetical protein Q4F95_08190 [Oscillospiraceae bacterium]|nr:hypothetical protein [Oscillospiraceae bacterium]